MSPLKSRPNHQRTLQILRSMTPAEKLAQVFNLNERTLKLFRIGLKRRFPNLDDAAFEKLDIEFMLTGSHASSLQGEARATHHIDFVARFSEEVAHRIAEEFPQDRFYVCENADKEAIHSKRMFNILEF